MSEALCNAVIPIDEQNGVECRGPVSVLTDAGPRCAECFKAFGDELVEDYRIHDLGSLMSKVIDDLTRKM